MLRRGTDGMPERAGAPRRAGLASAEPLRRVRGLPPAITKSSDMLTQGYVGCAPPCGPAWTAI